MLEDRVKSEKMAARSQIGKLVGYEGNSLYLILLPPGLVSRQAGGIVKTSHVTFNESIINDWTEAKWLKSADNDDDEPLDTFFFNISESTSQVDDVLRIINNSVNNNRRDSPEPLPPLPLGNNTPLPPSLNTIQVVDPDDDELSNGAVNFGPQLGGTLRGGY